MPLLRTYDPDWETRWTSARTSLEQCAARGDLKSAIYDDALGAMQTAYDAQFRSGREFFEHYAHFLAPLPGSGLQITEVYCPEEVSIDDASALLAEYRASVKRARAAKSRRPAEDPFGLLAFRTPASADTQRLTERFSLVLPGLRHSIETLLVIEATSTKLAICFIQLPDGGSVTNWIERLATAVFNEHPALRLSRTRSFLFGRWRLRYGPTDVAIYEYLPWSGEPGAADDFDEVHLDWSRKDGFINPRWSSFPSVPRLLRAIADEAHEHSHPTMLPRQMARMITSEPQTHGPD